MTPEQDTAFVELLPLLTRLAAKAIKPPLSAEDICQDAIADVLRLLGEKTVPGDVDAFKGWVVSAFKFRLLNLRKSACRRSRLESAVSLETLGEAGWYPKSREDGRDASEADKAVAALLPRLTPRQRQIAEAVLRGETYEAIGGRLGISKQRVEQILKAVGNTHTKGE